MNERVAEQIYWMLVSTYSVVEKEWTAGASLKYAIEGLENIRSIIIDYLPQELAQKVIDSKEF